MKIHWHILSDFFLVPRFLLISIVLTVINSFISFFFDLHVGRINSERFSEEPTFRCSEGSGTSTLLSNSTFNSLSASHSSWLSFGISQSQLQSSQISVAEMCQGAQFWSRLARSRSSRSIRWTFNTSVRPPGQFFAGKPRGKGDLTDNVNAAAPSCWKFGLDALKISSVSEMYPMAVICGFWAQDSFCIARRFWLPYYISSKLWTLGILCNVLSSTYLFIFKSFSVFMESNTRSSPANIPLLARANCLTMTFSWRVPSVVLDCLYPMTSRPKEKLVSTITPCGMIENMSLATLESSAYVEWFPFCWSHQLVRSGIQNGLPISIWS